MTIDVNGEERRKSRIREKLWLKTSRFPWTGKLITFINTSLDAMLLVSLFLTEMETQE